jgi:hypothetical protein
MDIVSNNEIERKEIIQYKTNEKIIFAEPSIQSILNESKTNVIYIPEDEPLIEFGSAGFYEIYMLKDMTLTSDLEKTNIVKSKKQANEETDNIFVSFVKWFPLSYCFYPNRK